MKPIIHVAYSPALQDPSLPLPWPVAQAAERDRINSAKGTSQIPSPGRRTPSPNLRMLVNLYALKMAHQAAFRFLTKSLHLEAIIWTLISLCRKLFCFHSIYYTKRVQQYS